MATIVPGILTSDEEEYQRRLGIADHVCKLIQIDIVDGEFANSLTVGPEIIKKYPPSNFLEIQLMVVSPKKYIDSLAPLPYVSRVIFPFEVKEDISEALYAVKKHNKQVGISINPETPVVAVKRLFDDVDLLLILAGKPGFSGQELGQWTYKKIEEAKRLDRGMAVEIDIGVNFENAAKLAGAGADFLVSTSALFNSGDFRVAYEKLAKLAANPQ